MKTFSQFREAQDIKKLSDKDLIAFMKKNDTDKSVGGSFGTQIKNARKELKRRGLKL